ncbi:hypothetical protein F5X68DRAFT_236436 [Plectosphaerella plurivora]|uniref:DUF1772-domain-containing protein n=1 Tax=Plectosphaerella plurivora TaxID=936078 RepID=A0A9P8V3E3_9PEZI|nr:hypothetical protein F5X68DRAFT_236436 [Plectosphaerella plurivora]
MSFNLDWSKALQLTSVVVTAHLAGFHYCSDSIVLYNAKKLDDTNALVKGWYRGWEIGRRIGPLSVLMPAIGFSICAWNAGVGGPGFIRNAVAAASMHLIMPYTVVVVFPVNDVLLAAHAKLTSAKGDDARLDDASIRANISEWQAADYFRMNLARIAVVAGVVAMLSV